MGRALFSSKVYTSTPIVRTEPEPVVDICEKWSAFNRFDPDSDEFFVDAIYEAVIDPAEVQLRQEAAMEQTARLVVEATSDTSSETSDSDAGSPMATGPDDPAVLIADAYPSVPNEWQQRFLEASSADPYRVLEERVHRMRADLLSREVGDNARSQHRNRPRSMSAVPVFVRSFNLGAGTTTTTNATTNNGPSVSASPSAAQTGRVDHRSRSRSRSHSRSRSRSPSPIRVVAPATPQRQSVGIRTAQALMTPSPPPSVTPRVYHWQNHSIPAMPTSPTIIRGNRDGPLTNPHARISFARLGAPVIVNSAN